MSLASINPTKTKSWNNLQKHFLEMQSASIKQMFNDDNKRIDKFHVKWNDFIVDYSKNIISQETINLLLELAKECKLDDAIEQQFSGKIINQTENREVLHTALRAPKSNNIQVNNENIIDDIYKVKEKIEKFTNQIVNGELKGYTNKPFTDVVNIGIGGSDLGPAMVVEALQYYKNNLNTHFVSNVDGDHVNK